MVVIKFKDHYKKQMKAPHVIYADFETIVEKIQGCKNKEHTEDVGGRTQAFIT